MDQVLMPQLIILAFLLIISAYFSGTEAAFFSLSSLEQDSLKRRSKHFLNRIMVRILSSPDEILITILTGNMFVNVIASTLAEVVGRRLFPGDSELYSIIAMTILLLLIGEMAPKNLAVRNSLRFSRAAAVPLYYIHRVLKPLRWFLNLFNILINRFFPLENINEKAAKQRLILSAVQIGFKEGILDHSELNLFESFFHFRNKSAVDVMIPRTQIKGIEISTPISQLIHRAGSLKNLSRSSLIPLFRQDMDHLVGFMDLKDLLPFKYGLKRGERLHAVVKHYISVPASKNCAELMVEMREANTEMALVVDEYGGTAGIITYQSLLEVLFSYFYPEGIEKAVEVSPGVYSVPGHLEIEDLMSLLKQNLPTEKRTVAGLITHQLEEIPEVGTKFIINQIEFTVCEIARNKILRVQVRRIG